MSNEKGTLSIEEQGIDTISEEERKGTPASLFFGPGSLPMFFHVRHVVRRVGARFRHFVLAGHRHDHYWRGHLVPAGRHHSIAGKRGNAPTMVLTRATSAWKVPKCQRL